MAVNEKVIQLAEHIRATANVGLENGSITNSEAAVAAGVTKLGHTLEQINQWHKDEHTLTAALAYLTGDTSHGGFKADPELNRVTGSYQIGQNEFNAVFDRMRKNRNPETGEDVISYGASSMNYVAGAAKNLGQLKQVRLHMKSQMSDLAPAAK